MKTPNTSALGILISFIISLNGYSQVTSVTLQVKVPVPDTSSRPVYVAGNFNHWYAGDSLYKMERKEPGIYTLILPVYTGRLYEYKYTRGNWDRVELAANDSNTNNRRFITGSPMQLTDTVLRWKIPVPRKEPAARASAINARLDSLKAGLQQKMGNVQELLKRYMVNMLSDNPKESLHKKLDRRAARKLGEFYKKLTGIVWEVMTGLKPEEKAKLRQFLSDPAAQKDFMGAFGKVLDGSVQ